MQLPQNIHEAEPWNEADRVPPGVYGAKVVEAEDTKSKNGNPMIVLTWRILDGEWRGAELKDYVTVIESTAGRIVALLQALQFAIPPDGLLDPKALEGKSAVIVCRNDPYVGQDGEMRDSTKIKAYKPRETGVPPSDLPSDFPVTAGAGVSDDDVPF
jgi:hypothetical protein